MFPSQQKAMTVTETHKEKMTKPNKFHQKPFWVSSQPKWPKRPNCNGYEYRSRTFVWVGFKKKHNKGVPGAVTVISVIFFCVCSARPRILSTVLLNSGLAFVRLWTRFVSSGSLASTESSSSTDRNTRMLRLISHFFFLYWNDDTELHPAFFIKHRQKQKCFRCFGLSGTSVTLNQSLTSSWPTSLVASSIRSLSISSFFTPTSRLKPSTSSLFRFSVDTKFS